MFDIHKISSFDFQIVYKFRYISAKAISVLLKFHLPSLQRPSSLNVQPFFLSMVDVSAKLTRNANNARLAAP
jgi:hypothetical protein